jgi:hypothetical protein
MRMLDFRKEAIKEILRATNKLFDGDAGCDPEFKLLKSKYANYEDALMSYPAGLTESSWSPRCTQ